MKLKIIILGLLSIFFIQINAQRTTSDIIKTDKGDLTIQPIVHGTIVLSFNNKTIYVDPYGGAEKFEGLAKPDIILITDIHGDHLNLETLNGINTKDAIFIVPQAVADKLPVKYKEQIVVLNNRQNIHRMGFYISAIAMYNLPETPDSRHTKGRGNGYIIDIGGKNIYISGDTEDILEMRQLQNIDVAFICMNLPYTMDIYQASSAVLEFKPKIVYPFHYRGANVKEFKEIVNKANPKIEVKLKEWYPKK